MTIKTIVRFASKLSTFHLTQLKKNKINITDTYAKKFKSTDRMEKQI